MQLRGTLSAPRFSGGSRATLLGAVAGTAVGISVWALLSYAASRPLECASVRGGYSGAQAQMEYLYVTDRSVAFMFVNSVAGAFDIPPYTAERAPDGSILLTFRGASTRNPDGTASYHGPNSIASAKPIDGVSLIEDADRSMRWRITLHEPICPRVSPLRYWTGSYSKALVIVTFGSVSTVTLEQVARPAKAPIWVNGSGFGPQRPIKLTAAGELLRETKADRSGMFSTAIFVPEVAPGDYVVLAEDDVGHRGEAALTITAGVWP